MSIFDRFVSFDIADIVATIVNEGEESFKNDLQQILEAIQSARAAKLHETRELQLTAYMLMREEGARLAGRTPDDPRVGTLAHAASAVVARAGELDREIDIAATRVPMVKKTEALVHGRISDANERGAAGVEVVLAGADGVALEGVKPVRTDDAGYYALVVPSKVAAEIGAATRLQVVVQRDGERVVPGSSAPIVVEPGVARLNDLKLGDEELRKLRLAPASGAVRSAAKPSAAARKAAGARRRRSGGPK